MASLKHNCPKCGRPAKIRSEFPFGKLMNYVYTCGHIELRMKLKYEDEVTDEAINSLIKEEGLKAPEFAVRTVTNADGKKIFIETDLAKLEERALSQYDWESPSYEKQPYEFKKFIPAIYWSKETVPEYYCEECQDIHNREHLYKYQRDGVAFANKTQLNCLIADEMGLGKTMQAIKALEMNKQIALSALVIVKGTTFVQWVKALKKWSFNKFMDVCPISSRNGIIPGFGIYVISMDLLPRKGILEILKTLNLRSIIVDESQSFKDSSSKRTIALINLIQDNDIKYKIMLSGTPVKNRANEYFVPLNLLAPSYFTSYNYFCRQYLLPDVKGQYSRLNPAMKEHFDKLTSRWIIRREAKDVQKDLPELRISYQMCEIEDEEIKKSYNHQLDLFNNYLRNEAKISSSQLLGWLAKLRSITGQAKVPNAVEFVRDFIDSTENDSIAIGIHHKSVRDTLKMVFAMDGLEPLTLSGEDDNFEKDRIANDFNAKKSRILIINMLAGGVGLNLQGGNNFLCIERSWNGADEDQFHKRFHRHGQKKKVHGTYLIAAGTIDEWFHNLVWEKRNNLASVGIGEECDESQSTTFLREFSEYVVSHKLK
jgi:SNF2 family DNA or RNA helicase